MATLKVQENIKNADGSYSVVHKETEAALVKMADGGNVETGLGKKMTASVYDPQGKSQDVFKYADDAAAAAKAVSVPTGRKVNGKALSADISLTAADVGARPSTWTPSAADVKADPSGSAAAVDAKLTTHTGDAVKHVTAAERTSWNGKAPAVHTHTADSVSFTDGETFQQKLDAGKLRGADGKDGPAGPAGKDGTNGKSAYQQAVDAGYTGTEAAFYAALVSLKDGPFLPESGGTMTGWINFSGPAGQNSGIIEFRDGSLWLKSEVGIKIGTETEQRLTVSGVDTPRYDSDAANKEYVDGKCLSSFGGFTWIPFVYNAPEAIQYANVGLAALINGVAICCHYTVYNKTEYIYTPAIAFPPNTIISIDSITVNGENVTGSAQLLQKVDRDLVMFETALTGMLSIQVCLMAG